jgi:hypothetical protein
MVQIQLAHVRRIGADAQKIGYLCVGEPACQANEPRAAVVFDVDDAVHGEP